MAAMQGIDRSVPEQDEFNTTGSWVYNPKSYRFDFVSSAYASIHGMAFEDLVDVVASSDHLFSEIFPDDKDRIVPVYRRCVEEGVAYSVEFRVIHPNGDVRWHHEVGAPILDDGGTVSKVVGTTQDITERKLRDEAAQHHLMLIKQVEEIAGLGHWIYDRSTDRFPYFSEEIAKIWNLPVGEELMQMLPSYSNLDYVHPDDRESLAEAYRQIGETGESVTIEFRILVPDGRTVWLRETAGGIRNEGKPIETTFGTVQDVTERKNRELEIRRDAELSNQAAEIAGIGYWLFDEVNFHCVYCNDELPRIRGLTKEEYLARASSRESEVDTIVPEDLPLVLEANKGILDGESYSIEYRRTLSDGSEQWLHEIGAPFHWDGGRVLLSIGTTRDITERKKFEELVRENEAKLEQSARMAKLGYWVWNDKEGRYESYSESAAAIFGATPEDFLKADLDTAFKTKSFHPDDANIIYDILCKMREDGEPFDVEYRIMDGDGNIQYLREIGEGEMDETGELVRIVGCTQDITEQKLKDEELRASEERHRLVLEGLADAAITIDTSGTIDYVNPAVETMFGYRKEELIGENIKLLMPEPHRSAHDGYISEYMKTGVAKVIGIGREVEGLRKDGTTFPLDLTINELRIGEQVFFLGTMRDITERKEFEESLIDARKSAEDANKAKLDFLANMSHELRTPLNAIIGFSEFINTEAFGPLGNDKYSEYLLNIENSGKHLYSLINDILDVSVIDSGELKLVETEVVLNDIVDEAIKMMMDRANAGEITLTNAIQDRSRVVLADERRLKQVVINLLSNAVKFTPPGGAISVDSEIAADESLLIRVSDTGIGMSAGEIANAMEKFGQNKRGEIMQSGEGTGLGLPLVKGLLDAHDGDMEIESAPDKGTTVTARLPAERIIN